MPTKKSTARSSRRRAISRPAKTASRKATQRTAAKKPPAKSSRRASRSTRSPRKQAKAVKAVKAEAVPVRIRTQLGETILRGKNLLKQFAKISPGQAAAS